MSALTPPGWISLPAATLQECGLVHLFEPADADRSRLLHQLRDGIYPRPFVLDDGETRRLHFDLRLVQSEQRIATPDALALAYTRAMTGFLLWQPQPREILLLGLGGGALARFCHHELASSQLTAVDFNPYVIRACRDWFGLPDDERIRVIEADALDHLAAPTSGPRVDVLLLDVYDADGITARLCTPEFYANACARLKPDGLLVANLSGHGLAIDTHLELLQASFGGRVLVADVKSEGNRIAFAFRNPAHPPPLGRLARQARELDQRFATPGNGFDFQGLLRGLGRNQRRRR